ncbi:hypothetical protein [Streptomyces sp. H51]|uniref:hypothetical protein n=1 Tax=Streptomyces sp. H51 TaxID=3111770 RepID=UPI002D77C980|nr:hypothetical protein [Streptomyces sp. H51]
MSSRLALLAMPGEKLTALPVDALARLLLNDLLLDKPPLNLDNWVRSIRRQHRKDPAAMGAVSEAVAWLRHHMYLVADLRYGADDGWVIVSRQGGAWLRGTDGDA